MAIPRLFYIQLPTLRLEASALAQLKQAYDLLKLLDTPPKNIGGIDKLQRHLDCAVIELLHALRVEAVLPDYQTVRAAFWEGDQIYPDAGLVVGEGSMKATCLVVMFRVSFQKG